VWVKLLEYDTDLDKLIAKGSMKNDPVWILDMMFKSAAAIKKLHNATICHFDIKE